MVKTGRSLNYRLTIPSSRLLAAEGCREEELGLGICAFGLRDLDRTT